MKRRQGWLFFIFLLLAISIITLINTNFKLGLDLKGGSQLTLQLIKNDNKVTTQELEAVKSVLDRRVNSLGLSQSNLQTLGKNQIVVELPGQLDRVSAARVLGETAMLEFGIQENDTKDKYIRLDSYRGQIEPLIKKYESKNKLKLDINDVKDIDKTLLRIEDSLGYQTNKNYDTFKKLNDLDRYIKKEIAKLFVKTDLTGKDLIKAGSNQQQTNSNWQVTLQFNKEGAEKFANITKSIAGKDILLGIILDDESISEAVVGLEYFKSGITGGNAVISSNSFNAETAKELEVKLRGGSLPIPIEIIESNKIGPLLGTRNITKSFYAGIAGLIFVGLFMVFNYRLLGFISVISLIFYGIYNLAIYSLIPVTLTLPGIAGLILSIGMAVDANILIFERIRDELIDGNSLVKSINNGFQRANSSIIDGHLTTLITCIALYWRGPSFVKGFAATLGIGVLTSLFTSLNCSKTFLSFLTSYQSLRQKKYFIKDKNLFKSNNISKI